jgi:NADP-dependent 3-hydroxy acid dehydrogenase YdfG
MMARNKQGLKVWFVTGASSSFGRVPGQAVLDRGDLLVATARQPVADLVQLWERP